MPEGGKNLISNLLEATEHPVGRLEMSLEGQELLLKRSASICRDFSTSLPLRIAVGLDDLAGDNRVAREVLYTRKKREYKVRIHTK